MSDEVDRPGWYARDDKDEDVVRVSRKDQKLKEFVRLCSLLENCIAELVRERDSPRVNDEYFLFRKELVEIKDKAIVESYNSSCLKWKF